MGYPKENSQIAKAWVEKTLALKQEQELYIPCDSKSAQASLKTRLYGARKEYASVDPIAAEGISFSPVYRDGKPYIKCYKSAQQANVAWLKDENGVLSEVIISADKDRTRKVLMLIKDGKTPEDAVAILGDLSEEEKQLFAKGVKK